MLSLLKIQPCQQIHHHHHYYCFRVGSFDHFIFEKRELFDKSTQITRALFCSLLGIGPLPWQFHPV